jgi:hypothetical protein
MLVVLFLLMLMLPAQLRIMRVALVYTAGAQVRG